MSVCSDKACAQLVPKLHCNLNMHAHLLTELVAKQDGHPISVVNMSGPSTVSLQGYSPYIGGWTLGMDVSGMSHAVTTDC